MATLAFNIYRTFLETGVTRGVVRTTTGTIVLLAADVDVSNNVDYTIYISTDNGATWTAKNTWSSGAFSYDYGFNLVDQTISLTIDDSNNLHVIYLDRQAFPPASGLYYRKLTVSGSNTWTLGSAVNILPTSGDNSELYVDIDMAGAGSNSTPVISTMSAKNTGTTNTQSVYSITGGTTVNTLFTQTVARTGQTITTASPITGRHANETTGGWIRFWYVKYANTSYKSSGANQPVLYVGPATGGGTHTATTIAPHITPFNAWLFTTGDKEATLIYVDDNSRVGFIRYAGESGAVTTLIDDLRQTHFNLVGAQVTDANTVILLGTKQGGSYYNPDEYPAIYVVDLTGNVVTLPSGSTVWDNTPGYYPIAGFNRNYSNGTSYFDMMFVGNANGTVYYSSSRNPGVPTNVTPANGAAINTDTPILTANVPSDPHGDQSLYKVQWQIASNTAFTTGVVNQYSGLVAGGGSVTMALDPVNKIHQGSWYMHARVISQFGTTSAWSPTTQFADGHAPLAANVTPSGGIALTYGTSGAVLVDWDFSDTSPTATQAAYEVTVTDTVTGSIIVDTNKVTSSSTSAVVNIPSASKDHILSLSVSVWDNDGYQGAYSAPTTFFVTDIPTPAITAPTNGATVTSGQVTITWSPNCAGTKTQSAYRVIIQQGATIAYDTGTVVDTGTSITLGTGIIHTGKTYTITLTVTDTLGVQGTTISNFSAAFTAPSPVGPTYLYDYSYRTNGFVWIGWTNVAIDIDFLYWTVYRRAAGDPNWTRLATVSENKVTYGYADFSAGSNIEYEYAVTQTVNRNQGGDIIESPIVASLWTTLEGDYYWLIDSLGLQKAIPVYNATADTYTDEYERSSYTVIGRGRHMDIGEHLGLSGSLTVALRDRSIGTGLATNFFNDPSFQDDIPLSSQWDYSATSNVSYSALTYYETSPSGYPLSLRVDADVNSTATFTQILDELPYQYLSDAFYVSCWIVNLTSNSFVVNAVVNFRDVAKSIVETQTHQLTQIEDWQYNGNWLRYGNFYQVSSLDASVVEVDVTIQITDTSGAGLSILLTGAQVNTGSTAIDYLDGDSYGGYWTGVPLMSPSATTGYYTARQQRQDIQTMASLGRPLYLRTPFGDVYQIALGDTALARLAGTGSDSELGDLTLPYTQVGL